jgi:hypothetical protein
MTEVLITPTELSGRLHISLRSLARMRADGSGPPFIRVSAGNQRGRVAYPESGVQAWLAKRTFHSTVHSAAGEAV